jgi:hypothetical protein
VRVERGKIYQHRSLYLNQHFVKVVFIYKKHCVYEYLGQKRHRDLLNTLPIWMFQKSYALVPKLKAQMLIEGDEKI